MKPLNEKIGLLLRNNREALGMTQLEVSKFLGYKSSQFISLVEAGKSKAPLDVLGKLCDLYKIPKVRFIDMISKDFYNEARKQIGV